MIPRNPAPEVPPDGRGPLPVPPLPAAGAEATATIDLNIRTRTLRLQVTVPTAPTSPRELLPLAQKLADAAVNIAVQDTERAGEPVACRAGCGACCRQPVPLGETEARHIADVVDRLPEPRRAEVRARFAAAREKLEAAGLTAAFRDPPPGAAGEAKARAREYFELGIACPFLEDESCSIYPDRPLVCREYLVTSPPEHCASLSGERIRRLELPIAPPFRAFASASGGHADGAPVPWVALVYAPEWAASHPEPPPDRTGPELLQSVVGHLTGAGRK